MTLFIDGGGFCSFWYCLGAITKVPKTFERVESVSSGAIVATLFVCMDTIDALHILKVALKSKRSFTIAQSIYALMDDLLPPDAHNRANNRLGIVLGNLKLQKHTVSHWDTREQLIHCIVASTHIPFITNFSLLHPVYSCIDGGFLVDKAEYKNVLSSPTFSKLEQYTPIYFTRALELFRAGQINHIKNSELIYNINDTPTKAFRIRN